MDIQLFRNPPNEYRPAPFWSWNDDLKARELVRQISEMERAGWGGFFMHARMGRVTPYLSRAWMDCIKACVREARKRSMLAWLYDEDKWPSGFAGGRIPAKGPSMRTKALLLSRKPLKLSNVKLVRAYEVDDRDSPGKVHEVARGGGSQNSSVLHFYAWTEATGDDWYFGQCYVDLMKPSVVKAFIESTHEAYRDAVGEEFGTAIPGIFTDEPNLDCFGLHRRLGESALFVPWTDDLPRFFRKRWGYGVRDKLLSLCLDHGDFGRV